ncbi:MAG: phosphatase PAP2 family protein [Candidatus Micrarchaeota archaeon]
MGVITSFISQLAIPFITEVSFLFQEQAYVMLALLTLLTFPFFKLRKRILITVLGVLLLIAVVYAAKSYYAQPRPCLTQDVRYPCEAGEPTSYQSFPSGHAAVSFLLVAATLGTPVFALYLILAFLISFTRLYLGVHTLNDVVAGIAIGIAVYALAEIIVNRFIEVWKKWKLGAS